jgi:hypothetical protein
MVGNVLQILYLAYGVRDMAKNGIIAYKHIRSSYYVGLILQNYVLCAYD